MERLNQVPQGSCRTRTFRVVVAISWPQPRAGENVDYARNMIMLLNVSVFLLKSRIYVERMLFLVASVPGMLRGAI